MNASTNGLRDIVAAVVSTPPTRKRIAAHRAPLLQNRGQVILWDDTFVRYHEPHIGIAAVKVLEALGFEVSLVKHRRCCGRPAFSQGNLDAAAKLAKHNISQLLTLDSQLSPAPILFLEPSCWSMFVEDYRELKIENAENIAARCFLFEKFVADLLAKEPEALRFQRAHRQTSSFTRIVMPNRFSIRRSWPRWPNVCLEEKPLYWTQRAAEWQAHSARSQKNTIYRSKSRNACSIKSTINPERFRGQPPEQK